MKSLLGINMYFKIRNAWTLSFVFCSCFCCFGLLFPNKYLHSNLNNNKKVSRYSFHSNGLTNNFQEIQIISARKKKGKKTFLITNTREFATFQ